MSAQELLQKLYKGKQLPPKKQVSGLRTKKKDCICECGECCGY